MRLDQIPADSGFGGSCGDGLDPAHLLDLALTGGREVAALVLDARLALRRRFLRDGVLDAALVQQGQRSAHALAWFATYSEAIGQAAAWAARLAETGQFGETEALVLRIGVGEYLAQIRGGIPMSQGEFARLSDLGLDWAPSAALEPLIAEGNSAAARARLAEILLQQPIGLPLGFLGQSEELDMIRETFRRFSDAEIAPHAHGWHLADALIPMDLVERLADMGVFGLTIPEELGGMGLGKEAMVVVSEELSRGYIGVGSLGTRSEIAAELILAGGTSEQQAHWLPLIASGAVLPTAVFTEPDTGSDLGALRSRAEQVGSDWIITGNKTWITHAARAGLMTLLVRTAPETSDHRGLSMFLAEKPPATEDQDFPAPGMSGGEIEVLGYRGMKEYDLAFDGFCVPGANLLGGVPGNGFRQLMKTFESARIQTAARAIGVAQNALDLGLRYAMERRQFGSAIAAFPRVSDKLVMMAVEIMLARQLTYHSAARKDSGERCDLEAGMAKLLAARVAWAAADNALQIHGGNGFALEYPISRVLCDARILNIFEGAGEIQAQVIARRLLESQ